MHKKLFLVFALCLGSVFADEITNLETLIATTQNQLEKQQQTLVLLKQFQQIKKTFMEKPDDARLGAQLVRVSMQLHAHIVAAHLTHLFTADFIEEIAFFNDVGQQHRMRP